MSSSALVRLADLDGSAPFPLPELSSATGIPLHQADEPCEFLLFYHNGSLWIRQMSEPAVGAIRVDFEDEALYYRQRRQTQPEALLKAAGLKQEQGIPVVDATAGLGLDAFLLASAGCQVTLFERSPILHALLNDGLRRAADSEEARVREVASRMHLQLGDSIAGMPALSPRPDLVYLDPMFPQRRKTAKVKKHMLLLQQLLHGQQGEAEEQLLATALACATRRVVVKRPRLASPLAGRKPSHSLEGKSSRFDVYTGLHPARDLRA
ncbi:MAG: class I SAM-dependent methyltransferase [Pseudomonadales bacterium]|nr:class I SAM-dependent methyltransferase [Pseudomonadales bacterium]MCP5331131.1 class I SAM-dependent methyltransferase [Pseudomonadales bacterium]MCP5343594.1 class I SAM-dependent methyltransferase [Pseudomonadales bacterium]